MASETCSLSPDHPSGPESLTSRRALGPTGGRDVVHPLVDLRLLLIEPTAGHRLAAHTADCILEAWGPDRLSCLVEAMKALTEVFSDTSDAPVLRSMPVSVDQGTDAELLISLLEEEIYTIDVFGVVPVGFHLSETDTGGVAGRMDVVDAKDVELIGPVPKAVSYHELRVQPQGGEWRCRVVIDV